MTPVGVPEFFLKLLDTLLEVVYFESCFFEWYDETVVPGLPCFGATLLEGDWTSMFPFLTNRVISLSSSVFVYSALV